MLTLNLSYSRNKYNTTKLTARMIALVGVMCYITLINISQYTFKNKTTVL